MRNYEGIFIFPPEGTPEVRKKQSGLLEELIKKFQGSVLHKTENPRRPLGYRIKKFNEGYCFVFDFQVPPSQMTELRKTLELQEDLLKFMLTVKPPAALKPAEPSAAEAASRPAPASPVKAG